MTNQEAIKYLKQLYPYGGCCWLDEQRIEAIGMAVSALERENLIKIGETGLYFDYSLNRAFPETEESISGMICPSVASKILGTDDICEIELFVRRKEEE